MDIDGFQISDAVPIADGSFVTSLVDADGQQVGTVRLLPDGSTQASLPTVVQDGGGSYDWSALIGKVTGFLNNAAATAKGVADEATRISRGISGAAAGARTGYDAPIDWKPYAVAGAAVIVALAIVAGSSSSSRRR